jgi:hypothetical protein
MDPATLAAMPPQGRSAILESLASSLSTVFWWAIVFAVAVPVLAAFVKEIPLRGAAPSPDGDKEPVAPPA